MADIKITLETLYDILRNEKKREDLQQLEASFFIDVVSYVREKQALLQSKTTDNNIFAAGEREKLEYELRSIKRILKEIYEKREKKIIDIALNRSRTGSDIIDTSAMLREESEFYEQILQNLDTYRKGILLHLFKGQLPFIDTPAKEFSKKPVLAEDEPEKPTDDTTVPSPELSAQEDSLKTRVRFIHPMPSFVWKDMKVYGPYEVGEEIEIFPEVAELLVRKKRAEKI